MPVLIEPHEPNPLVARVLRDGRRARLQYEKGRGMGEREKRKSCCNCGDPIEPARLFLSAVTCAACSPYKEVSRP